jgi:4'-phosphopantetheinyl transferase
MRSLALGEVEIFEVATTDERCLRRSVDYLSILCDRERRRHDAFHFERDRHLYRVSHALLRQCLSHYHDIPPADWRFEEGTFGRPEIVARSGCPPLRFSLSHTHGLAACAVTLEMDIGLDVEAIDRDIDVASIAEHVFSVQERQCLAACGGSEQRDLFFRYWTLKEAYIKAVGAGMTLPLQSISFRNVTGGEPRIDFEDAIDDLPDRWRFWQSRPSNGNLHRMALAIASGPVRPAVTTFDHVP